MNVSFLTDYCTESIAHGYGITFFASMTPLIESRAGIPLGYFCNLSIYESVGVAFLAGVIVLFLLLKFLPPVISFLERRIPFFHKILDGIMKRIHSKHSQKIKTVGEAFLVLLVAIPLPGSGVFTGSALAYVFKIPFKRAFPLITLGLFLGVCLIGFLTVSGVGLWDLFFGKG